MIRQILAKAKDKVRGPKDYSYPGLPDVRECKSREDAETRFFKLCLAEDIPFYKKRVKEIS